MAAYQSMMSMVASMGAPNSFSDVLRRRHVGPTQTAVEIQLSEANSNRQPRAAIEPPHTDFEAFKCECRNGNECPLWLLY